MGVTTFLENLKTHEMKMKVREDREPHKKIGIAFKASLREHKKKNVAISTISDDGQEDDEELILLVKNMRRMYYKSERRSDPRRKGKMKALKATTWDSDSGSESEDSAHMCFMVQGDDPCR